MFSLRAYLYVPPVSQLFDLKEANNPRAHLQACT